MCKKMCKNITLNDVKDSAFLADQAYNNFPNGRKITNPATGSSFEVVKQVNDENTGFSGTVFKNTDTNEYVIAFRGSDDIKGDWIDHNSKMLFKKKGPQFDQAFDFANKEIAEILAKDPDAKISTTGHSLGGSLAQAVGAKSKLQTTTFNAFGIGAFAENENILTKDEINSAKDNVTNIYDSRDPISNGNLFGGEQLGKSIALDTGGNALLSSAGLAAAAAAAAAGLATRSPAVAAGVAGFAGSLEKHLMKNLSSHLDKVEPFLPFINICLYDPIALDLNNNGKIDTLSLENGVFFDHNGDEIAFKSSWISGGDGILARDINSDKEINSGAELFGNFTKLKNGELAKNGA